MYNVAEKGSLTFLPWRAQGTAPMRTLRQHLPNLPIVHICVVQALFYRMPQCTVPSSWCHQTWHDYHRGVRSRVLLLVSHVDPSKRVRHSARLSFLLKHLIFAGEFLAIFRQIAELRRVPGHDYTRPRFPFSFLGFILTACVGDSYVVELAGNRNGNQPPAIALAAFPSLDSGRYSSSS